MAVDLSLVKLNIASDDNGKTAFNKHVLQNVRHYNLNTNDFFLKHIYLSHKLVIFWIYKLHFYKLFLSFYLIIVILE